MVTHSWFLSFYSLVGRQHRAGPDHRANAVKDRLRCGAVLEAGGTLPRAGGSAKCRTAARRLTFGLG